MSTISHPPLLRDEALRSRIAARLSAFEHLPAPATPGQHAAAVALAIVDEGLGADHPGIPTPGTWSPHAALVLTRRAAHLRKHAGQWALPGGRIDAGESAVQAALRELSEEIGLVLDDSAVLGCLDDYVTRSGFAMTPVVVWAGAARELQANPQEVASIHRIPLAELLRQDAPLLDIQDDADRPVLRMPVGSHWIAAPTAALLYQFREVCLCDRPTRVAHFDQPRFAWK